MCKHSNKPMQERNLTRTELKTTKDYQPSILDQNMHDLLQLHVTPFIVAR